MPRTSTPPPLSRILATIAKRQRAREQEAAQERADKRVANASRQARRDAALPAAAAILSWATGLAESGALDDLGDGWLCVDRRKIGGGEIRLDLRRDGALVHTFAHYRGGGVKTLRSVDRVTRYVDHLVIEELAALIAGDKIWVRLSELNGSPRRPAEASDATTSRP